MHEIHKVECFPEMLSILLTRFSPAYHILKTRQNEFSFLKFPDIFSAQPDPEIPFTDAFREQSDILMPESNSSPKFCFSISYAML